MADHPHILAATAETFEHEVITASRTVPVLVDYWASWCGPCQSLMPVLEALAAEYAGAFRLAKVNIDEQQELAGWAGVRSVPTVQLFKGGQVVEQFTGAQPEGEIRALLDRHIERASDALVAQAVAARDGGDVDGALQLLQQAVNDDPHNPRVRTALAETLMGAGRFEEAERSLEGVAEEVAGPLREQLAFARAAAEAPDLDALQAALEKDPGDSTARYQLGTRLLAAGDYEAALEAFLELMRRDRAYGDDAGRKALLQVFEMLGAEDERVGRYRRLMARALY